MIFTTELKGSIALLVVQLSGCSWPAFFTFLEAVDAGHNAQWQGSRRLSVAAGKNATSSSTTGP